MKFGNCRDGWYSQRNITPNASCELEWNCTMGHRRLHEPYALLTKWEPLGPFENQWPDAFRSPEWTFLPCSLSYTTWGQYATCILSSWTGPLRAGFLINPQTYPSPGKEIGLAGKPRSKFLHQDHHLDHLVLPVEQLMLLRCSHKSSTGVLPH